MIFLGDTVTGFEGVATARTEHVSGRTEIRIERRNGDSGFPEDAWFDEPRVALVEPTTPTFGFGHPQR